MVSFLIILGFMALITVLIYSPAIIQYFRWKQSEKKFKKKLQLLEGSELYNQCRIIFTKPLGIGTDPNGEVSFADAMKNQEFAMNSILGLIK